MYPPPVKCSAGSLKVVLASVKNGRPVLSAVSEMD
jgi:hypothetical protein